jgi:hypothetical protein
MCNAWRWKGIKWARSITDTAMGTMATPTRGAVQATTTMIT